MRIALIVLICYAIELQFGRDVSTPPRMGWQYFILVAVGTIIAIVQDIGELTRK